MTTRRELDTIYGGRRWQIYALLLLTVSALPSVAALDDGGAIRVRKCDAIQVGVCQNLGYNHTSMPNLVVGHDTQQEADALLATFNPLIQFGCSNQLQFFLCSVYVPMCNEQVHLPIGPCRPLCESVRNKCEPVLQNFGYPWPAALACDKFPAKNDYDQMCMDGPQVSDENAEDREWFNNFLDRRGTTRKVQKPPSTTQSSSFNFPSDGNSLNFPSLADQTHKKWMSGVFGRYCSHLKNPQNFIYINRTGECALLCEKSDDYYGPRENLFLQKDKNFSNVWMIVFASACFAGTLFTVLTFLIDMSRVPYPDKCVVFIAVCYNIYAVAYIVRLLSGRGEVSCHHEGVSGQEIMISDSLDNTNCTVVFLLSYYFGLSGQVWWASLTVAWFLSVGPKWSSEKLYCYSTFFHIAAWVLPAILMITLLIMRNVGSDELTGMCSVSNQSSNTYMGFIIVPSIVCLSTGVLFLLSGLVSMCLNSKRNHDPLSQTSGSLLTHSEARGTPIVNPPEQTVSLPRTGIFVLVYCVPAVCLCACYFYEHINRHIWEASWSTQMPNVEIFMLKILMSLIVGVMCAIWTICRNGFSTWRLLIQKSCFKKNKRSPQLQMYNGYSYQPQQFAAQERNKYMAVNGRPVGGKLGYSAELAHV